MCSDSVVNPTSNDDVLDSHWLFLGLKRGVLGAFVGSENGEERAVRRRELSKSGPHESWSLWGQGVWKPFLHVPYRKQMISRCHNQKTWQTDLYDYIIYYAIYYILLTVCISLDKHKIHWFVACLFVCLFVCLWFLCILNRLAPVSRRPGPHASQQVV